MDEKYKVSEFQFELSLVIIGILIPLFLNSLPALADRLGDIFALPLTGNIVLGASFLLGILWLGVLMIGLSEFRKEERVFFEQAFLIGVSLTSIILIALFSVYFAYLLNFFLGLEKIIYLSVMIVIILVTKYLINNHGKKIKN